MKISRKLEFILLFFFVFLIYGFFLSSAPFVAHDWPLLFKESRNFFPFWTISWDYMGSGGIGASAFKTMWIDLYANFVYFVSNTSNIPWWLSQRIFWIVPFVLISIFSSYKFSGLFVRDSIYKLLSAIIYSFNTYILLIVGGGQFGIAFSYALSPLVLYGLFKLFEKNNLNTLFTSSLLSGVLIALDPRISFLTFGIAAFWYLFIIRDFSFNKLKYVFLNFVIAGLLNSYWVLPGLLSIINSGINSSVTNYFSVPGVKFLSFATFENSFSFLHPNWPENIFGKIYFQKPEFLLLPIIAFSSMLFLKNSKQIQNSKLKILNNLTIEQSNNRTILFFVVLGLLGAFLAKGANEPFGQVYLFLFQKIPGFNLFRDPTKFYILIALSYSILIPYSIFNITQLLKSKIQSKYQIFNFSYVFFIFTILYLLFLLRPAWSGELTGIFKPKGLPEEYVKFNQVLEEDKEFGRTLWIPRRQKYGFFAPLHPAADSEVLFAKKDISKLSEEELSDLSIKYVIVPYDLDSEIFLRDRKYDEKSYLRMIQRVEKLGLKKVDSFGKVIVYQTQSYKDHFWCVCDAQIEYKFINPSEYELSIKKAKKGDVLVFSEGFDKGWMFEALASKGETFRVQSEKFGNLNSFVLPENGDYELKVYYQPQEWVNIGLVISFLTLLGLISSLFLRNYRK